MGDLNITPITKDEAEKLNGYDISLKLDGTLIYYINGRLLSPRCERSDRFSHILKILKDNNMPNCVGEMFIDIPNANVFDVSRSENWARAKFMIFDLMNSDREYKDRQNLLDFIIKQINNPFIIGQMKFNSFQEGWTYCLNNNSEGLVLRNENKWFKCKILKEDKIEIIEHEKGKDKGTFILKNGSRISGTSLQFVIQYTGIKNRGKKAIAEIEYPFMTKEGRYFQPRLRQIVEVEK